MIFFSLHSSIQRKIALREGPGNISRGTSQGRKQLGIGLSATPDSICQRNQITAIPISQSRAFWFIIMVYSITTNVFYFPIANSKLAPIAIKSLPILVCHISHPYIACKTIASQFNWLATYILSRASEVGSPTYHPGSRQRSWIILKYLYTSQPLWNINLR